MTIVTTNEPEFSFGKGRIGWIIDSGIKIATELLEFDYSKYAELPPTGKQIGFPKKRHKKTYQQFGNGSKLQANYRRRSSKSRCCYKHNSYNCNWCRQLYRSKRSKQRSSYRGRY